MLVEWLDSTGCHSSWQSVAHLLEEPAPHPCSSVGWVLYDGEDCLLIAPHWAPETKYANEQACGDMSIPRVAIVNVVDLVPAPQAKRKGKACRA